MRGQRRGSSQEGIARAMDCAVGGYQNLLPCQAVSKARRCLYTARLSILGQGAQTKNLSHPTPNPEPRPCNPAPIHPPPHNPYPALSAHLENDEVVPEAVIEQHLAACPHALRRHHTHQAGVGAPLHQLHARLDLLRHPSASGAAEQVSAQDVIAVASWLQAQLQLLR